MRKCVNKVLCSVWIHQLGFHNKWYTHVHYVEYVHTYNNPIAWSFSYFPLIAVCTCLLEIYSANAFSDFNVIIWWSVWSMEKNNRAHDKKCRVLGQISWQICHRSDLSNNFQTLCYYNCCTWYTKFGNAVWIRGHAVFSLKQLAGISCKALENVLCPAVIMSPEPKWHIFSLVMIMWFSKLPN